MTSLQTKDTKTFYKGPANPLTSVAIGGERGQTIFAGCWDKYVWSWDAATGEASQWIGHSDFVNAVVCANLSGKSILLSGGSDKRIIVWDATTGQVLHKLRDKLDNMRAVRYLAIDPVASSEGEIVLLSASSDPKIRRWKISLDAAEQIMETAEAATEAIHEHETSVYSLFFDINEEEADLYTASADGTARCLSRAKNWKSENAFEHGDYVDAVVVTDDWVVTAGRNEDIKVWDKSSGKLWFTYEGHFEEVKGLVVLDGGKKVASAGIDGTIRLWSLTKKGLLKAKEEKEEIDKGLEKEVVEEKKSLMTAEEEAELAELMDDSD